MAIAAELSRRYDSIVLLEQHQTFGLETSSRNSEVIHSGIYYPEGSLKARLCVEGAEMLYGFCNATSVPYKKTGKLIVAPEESEVRALNEIYDNGIKNGVEKISCLEREDIKKIEPDVNGVAALHLPHTGIIDSHGLMNKLYHIANANGVILSFNTKASEIKRHKEGFSIGINNKNYFLKSKVVINAAGLASDGIALLSGIDIDKEGYRLKYCKGSYFSYSKKSPIRTLVYPVPHTDLKGLGIHAVLDMSGRLRFGPDAEDVDSIDYKVDIQKKGFFYKGASRIIKNLDCDAFVPDMAGVRPKISGNGIKDFIIKHESDKELYGLINLVGIESPGLTASLAIAKYVGGLVDEILN